VRITDIVEDAINDRFDIKGYIRQLPKATVIIGTFWVLVLIFGSALGFSIPNLLSNAIQRFGLWGLFVLAMIPSIQSGTGPNFALPIGICGGLFATVTAIEIGFTGGTLLLVAGIMAVIMGCALGYVYGKLMNTVKGSEMAIATYTGFSITFLFCLLWTILPYTNPNIGWFMGEGLRNFIAMEPLEAERIIDSFMKFSVFGIDIPLGTILLVLICCVLMWLFFRSKTGLAITASGMNPMFAAASGLNVDKNRVIANMISTSLAAVGIIVYAQGFGLLQLYDGPLLMAFPAVAAILVGGASAQKSRVINVVIGTFLYQGILANAPPVFGKMLQGADMTDAVRMVVQNGVILYALTQLKRGAKA